MSNQVHRLDDLVAGVDALGDEEKDLIKAESVVGLLDLSGNGIWASHQLQRHPLTELASPIVPKPFHVLKLLLCLKVRWRTNSYATPRSLVPLWFFGSVSNRLFSVGLPERFTKVEVVAQDYWSAAILRPKQRRLHRHGETTVQRRMGILEGTGSYPYLVDGHVGVYARPIVGINGVRMRVEVVIGEFPKFAFVTERRVLQRCDHYFDKFFKKSAVVLIHLAVFVPIANRG